MDVTGSLNEVGLFDLLPVKRPGQPTKINRSLVEKMAKLFEHGFTDEEAAQMLGVSRFTIWQAKKNREYSNTVLRAKETADREMVKALYLRGVGFSHPDEKVFCHDGKIIVHKTMKHYPPDTGAITLWLINRQREHWRKEIQKEENRPDQRAPMIRVMERVSGKEAAQIKATGDAVTVLLGADFVSRVHSQQKQVEANGHTNGTGH